MDTIEPEVLPAEPSIEDHAAHDYKILLEEMTLQLQKFPGEQLKRVMMAIAEYPFEKQQVYFSYPQEQLLFSTFAKLLDCKFVLMRAVLEMKKDEIEKLLAEQEKEGKTNAV